jgi:hypothetical protein
MNLCDTCQNCRTMRSDRGSVFLLCQLAFTDASFPKYPRLPVVECRGYSKKISSSNGDPAATPNNRAAEP